MLITKKLLHAFFELRLLYVTGIPASRMLVYRYKIKSHILRIYVFLYYIYNI